MTKKQRSVLIQLAILVFCIGAVVWTVSSMGVEQVFEIALSADPFWLLLSFLPIFGRFLIWAFKWRRMMRRRGSVAYRTTLRALLAGCFVNLTTPTAKLAGGFLRAAIVHRQTGWRMSISYGWSLADQLTNTMGNAMLFGILALLASLTLPGDPTAISLVTTSVLILGVIAAYVWGRPFLWRQAQKPGLEHFLARIVPERFRKPEKQQERKHWVLRVFSPLLGEGGATDAVIPDLLLAAVSFGCLCFANALVLKALGADAPIFLVATAVIMGYFAGTAIGTMGGIGATEFFLIHFYTLAGIPDTIATAGALLHRASYYLVTMAWGGVALVIESRLKRKTDES